MGGLEEGNKMVTFNKCKLIVRILELAELKCMKKVHVDRVTNVSGFGFTNTTTGTGFTIFHRGRFLITYDISRHSINSSVVIPDLGNPDEFHKKFIRININALDEGRMPVLERFTRNNTGFEVPASVSLDEEEFDSVCFQHSLLTDGSALFGVMIEPFISSHKFKSSEWVLRSHLLEESEEFMMELITVLENME